MVGTSKCVHQPVRPCPLARTLRPSVGRHRIIRLASNTVAPVNDGFTYLPLHLPPSKFSQVKTSQFIKSSKDVRECPPLNYPEFAVIGRSNVGKSSLINTLTGNDKLAKVSKEPGMTKLINHYLINDSWYLVDLPGYGYAKAGKEDRKAWISFTKRFFVERDTLVHVFLLLDSTLPPQPLDVDCAQWLSEVQVPFSLVFTKLDAAKRGGPAPQANIRQLKTALAEEWEALPWCFETSSKTGAGRSELLSFIASLRDMHLAAERRKK